MRPKLCPECRAKYQPVRQMQPCCENEECKASFAIKHIETSRKRRQMQRVKTVRTEKRQDADKLARLKPGYLESKMQDAVNEFVRVRDFEEGCISCDKDRYWSGQWHAGHLIPRGRSSFLRYHLWNLNKQCSQCNHKNGGMVADHERGIALRYGPERLEYLKSAPRLRRYEDDYLIRGAKTFRRKTRILKKRKGIQ